MAIANYTDLQAAIANWLARSDLTSFIPDFVTLAENVLNYGTDDTPALRCREMEATSQRTPTSGICTLPTDYLEYRSVAENTSTRRPMTYMTPDMANVLYPSRQGGIGAHFTIIGQSLYTYPLVQNDVELVYYQAIPPLASNATNWLLSKAPGVYLRASLMQAAEFIKDNEEVGKQGAMLRSLMAGLNRSDMLGKYARAGLTPRGITP